MGKSGECIILDMLNGKIIFLKSFQNNVAFPFCPKLVINPSDVWNWNIPGKLGQYYDCWCPGSLCYKDISNPGIELYMKEKCALVLEEWF